MRYEAVTLAQEETGTRVEPIMFRCHKALLADLALPASLAVQIEQGRDRWQD